VNKPNAKPELIDMQKIDTVIGDFIPYSSDLWKKMRLEKLKNEADDHINDERYSKALEASNYLDKEIKYAEINPEILPDGLVRKYSIIIVAHQKNDDQKELANVSLKLDPSRFEIIFVENATLPIFPLSKFLSGRNITLIRMKFNAGIGIARNIAIRHATGKGCIFIDDDGVTSESDIEKLISTYEAYDAVAVRGRVVSRTNSDFKPDHYNCGQSIVQRYCDIEGFAIWRTEILQRTGMFDPILYGHEGAELTARLYPHFGPDAFLYEPNAILLHDYAKSNIDADQKNIRYKKLTEYCLHKNPNYKTILNTFKTAVRNPVASASLGIRREFLAQPKSIKKSESPKSIISTCYNCAPFMEAFAESLNRQTDKNFELIFVDDGSDDNSPELIERFLNKDIRRKIVVSDHIGRGSALNLALSKANYEICAMADVDDIMLPRRMEWTNVAYNLFPDADMLGFMIFDINNLARGGRPIPHNIASLQVRKILGMPTPFPSFSFNASRIPERFDEELTAGIDCDWIFRALQRDDCMGYLIPLNTTFYRTHSGQITHTGRQIQRNVALHHIKECHIKLLGQDNVDENSIKLLAGWDPIQNGQDYWRAHDYGLKLIAETQTNICSNDAVQFSLIGMQLLHELHLEMLKNDYQKLKNVTTQK
jgi:glycosyltransferase involved in cell wall biosynthesis